MYESFASVSKHTKKTLRIISSKNLVWKISDRWNCNKAGPVPTATSWSCYKMTKSCAELLSPNEEYWKCPTVQKRWLSCSSGPGYQSSWIRKKLLLMNQNSGNTLWRWKSEADTASTKKSWSFCQTQTQQLTLNLQRLFRRIQKNLRANQEYQDGLRVNECHQNASMMNASSLGRTLSGTAWKR